MNVKKGYARKGKMSDGKALAWILKMSKKQNLNMAIKDNIAYFGIEIINLNTFFIFDKLSLFG